MGKHALRKDMTCLNCHHVVEKRFCPNCGQENKHPKESFHFLFTHFAEDFTHYDGSFWKTIKHLLFSPAKLTVEYINGKRQMYVPPVKLYIFISFITFFLLSVLPIVQENEDTVKITDSNKQKVNKDLKLSEVVALTGYRSVAAYDSLQKTLPENSKSKGIKHWTEQKMVKIVEENTVWGFTHKFKEAIFHNLPKVLFLYMPLFAFVLLLFHNKKRWYYYEHGVFTLHYFSMILLSFTVFMLLSWVLSLFGSSSFAQIILFLLAATLFFWWNFYFFRSHSRFYQESKLISRVKGIFILLINFLLIGFFLCLLIIYSALNVN